MKEIIQKKLFIFLGWSFVLLGSIGVVLPILPTTPFLILALVLFSKSSPRFHQMLLDNRWFGARLKQWEDEKTVSRRTKRTASISIVATFVISIAILHERPELQSLLVMVALILLLFIWRLKEDLPDTETVKSFEKRSRE